MAPSSFRLAGALALAALVLGSSSLPANASEALWSALRSGTHVAMMRHALAPGTGDPGTFRLGDCATQRNLNDEGHRQAEAIGSRFRSKGIGTSRVYSSQWCRCLETARLLASAT